jgi:hypothetical protein
MVTRRPKLGDVFIIPIGDGLAAVGQVVGVYLKNAYYFAIFDTVFPIDQAKGRAVDSVRARPLLLALSLDAKLHAGDWTIVGSAPVAADAPLPAYKETVHTPDRVDVVDHSGTRRRAATATEAEVLPNRKVVAPVRLERALRAWLGMEPWSTAFDELRVDRVITTADMFG